MKIKKILAVLVFAVLLFVTFPLGTFTASAETISGTCGENLTWAISDKVLTISGTGDMINYSEPTDSSLQGGAFGTGCAPWFAYDIDKVIIEDGVTSIGSYAFNGKDYEFEYGFFACYCNDTPCYCDGWNTTCSNCFFDSWTETVCSNLNITEIIIPDSVEYIGMGAFYGCDSLECITLPITNGRIGVFFQPYNYDFESCYMETDTGINECVPSSLKTVILSQKCKDISASAFAGCSSIRNFVLSEGIENIGEHAFYNCINATINIPNSITNIGIGALYNTISYNNTNNWIDDVLYIDNHLISCKFPKSGEYSIKNGIKTIAGGAFSYSSNLTNVIIPDSVINIGNSAFYNCSSLTSITIPESVRSIYDWAFYNCTSLSNIYYRGNEDNKTYIYIGSNNKYLNNAVWHYNSCINSETHTYTNNCDEQCDICGNIRTTSHVYNTVITEPTCTENGYTTYTCAKCNDSYISDEISAKGHTYTSTVTPPTCTENGYTTYTCTCGDKYIDNEVSAIGHSFSDWKIRTNADCETDGEKYRICSTCKYEETMTIPAHGHSFSEVFDIYKEPTDFEEGLKFRVCTNLCGAVTDETVIPKTSLADGICGENAKWAVRADGTLIIAGNGATDNYKLPSYAPWSDYSNVITQIIISETISKIGNNNFGNFTALDKVVIENPHCSFGLWVFPDDTSKFSIYSMGGSNVEEYANSNGITLVKPENPNTPIAPVLKFRTESSVELTKIDGYEYSIDGVNWQIEPLFENLISGTNYTFYQRIAGGVYAPSEKSEPLYISTLAKPDSPIIESVDKNKVTLQHKEGFEYSINGINWQNSNVFNKIPFDTLICFYQRKTATETDGTTSASEPTKCIIASTPKVLVGESSIKVTPKENYEYCIDDMVWQDSNIFTKYIIPNETYTVYQRPKAQENIEIFYDTEGITVCVNGTDSLTVPNATHLVWLKKILLSNDGYCSISADFNNDSTVDIRDLVRLKKTLATTISTKIEYNIPYVSYAESQYSDLRVTKFTFTTDGMCSVDDFHYTKLSEQTEDSLVYNGEYYGNAEGGGNSGIFTINENIITVTSAEEYNYGDLLWKFTVNSDGSLTLTEIGNDFEDMFITGTVYITE